MNLSDKVSKQERSHDKIVRKILPRFAEKLKKEAVISAYDRHPFKIPLVEGWPPIKIIPDLVVHLPNGERVLIEIANPRDPKRFLGEIVYPHLLIYHKKIEKRIVFVLHDLKQQEIHDRGFSQIMMLRLVFENLAGGTIASWPPNEETAYHNLKRLLKQFLNSKWSKTRNDREEES